MEDEKKPDEEKRSSRKSGEPPRLSVKTVGQAASKFDEGMTKGLVVGIGGMFHLFSTRLRQALQSGHWENYAFIVFAALIFAAAMLVVYMRFFGG